MMACLFEFRGCPATIRVVTLIINSIAEDSTTAAPTRSVCVL